MADAAVSGKTFATPLLRRGAAWGLLIPLLLVTIGLTGTFNAGALDNFMVVFSSLLVGAIPLVMLGALVAAGIGTFVPQSFFQRLALLPEPLQIPAAGFAGLAFPVCECGSVPVARKLISRGLVPSAAVTFMLAAPILNPIVVLSTYIAYRGSEVLWPMVLGRIGLGFTAAAIVGWVVGGRDRGSFLKGTGAGTPSDCGCSGGQGHAAHADHSHGDASRVRSFFGSFAEEFIFMGRFLIFGALVAAALQTLLPQSALEAVGGLPIISLLAMMALAFALSLCSESDAFVAASFVQFGVGPQLAFLVFGPMMDAKLAFLYRATFSKGFLKTVVVTAAGVTLVGTMWMEVLFG